MNNANPDIRRPLTLKASRLTTFHMRKAEPVTEIALSNSNQLNDDRATAVTWHRLKAAYYRNSNLPLAGVMAAVHEESARSFADNTHRADVVQAMQCRCGEQMSFDPTSGLLTCAARHETRSPAASTPDTEAMTHA